MEELNIFDEQIQKRKSADESAFEGAFGDLVSILDKNLGEKIKKRSSSVQDAMGEILFCLGLKTPLVPEGLKDAGSRMEYMLSPSGCMRRRVELKGRWWKNASDPFLGFTAEGEPVALLLGKTGKYTYRDKDRKIIRINGKTAHNIKKDAFCFYRPLPLRKLRLTDLGSFMIHSARIKDVVYILIVSLIVSLLGLATPYVNKLLYGTVIPSGIKANIYAAGFLLTGAAVGSVLFTLARSLILARFSVVGSRVQSAAMMRVLSLPVAFFRKYAAGEVANRMSCLSNIYSSASNTLLSTGLSALFSFVYLFQMRAFSPLMTLPAFLIIAAMLAASLITVTFQMKVSRRIMEAGAKLSALLFALISGIQKIKLTGAKKRAFAKWAACYKEVGQLKYSPPVVLRLAEPVSLAISLGGAIWLYYLAGSSGITASDYLAFMSAYGALSGTILALTGIARGFSDIRVNLQMFRPIMEQEPEVQENKRQVSSLSGSIEINNISFRYDPQGPLILDNISLKMSPGDYVAVVGKTGCGKSTLLRLLLGFEKPESGAIYYDGNSLDSLDLRSLRQNIGVDMQNGKLLAGSIFENIVLTSPWKTLDAAWEAASLAGIIDDIHAMPMGMHTVIAEGGGGLSGGQKQRLLIARALIAKPKVLFFDEATSALDNITQKKVSDSIASLKATRIVIAHRLSTIRNCDRILMMAGGKIVEEGCFDELLDRHGEFYELVKRQTI